jgi:hypothetical protein
MKEPIATIESAMIAGVRSLRIFKPPLSCAWLFRPKSDSAFRRGDGHFPPAVFAIFLSAFIADIAVRRAALRFRRRAVSLGLSVYGLIGALLSRLLIRLSFPHFFK